MPIEYFAATFLRLQNANAFQLPQIIRGRFSLRQSRLHHGLDSHYGWVKISSINSFE